METGPNCETWTSRPVKLDASFNHGINRRFRSGGALELFASIEITALLSRLGRLYCSFLHAN